MSNSLTNINVGKNTTQFRAAPTRRGNGGRGSCGSGVAKVEAARKLILMRDGGNGAQQMNYVLLFYYYFKIYYVLSYFISFNLKTTL